MIRSTRKCVLAYPVFFLFASLFCEGFQITDRKASNGNLDGTTQHDANAVNRKRFLIDCGLACLGVAAVPSKASAKSYSANARNMEKMNSGDMSGGSLYDNNPTSAAGKRRRAMAGCKTASAREEAAESVLKISSLPEKECNQMVLEGESKFMLEALRILDCPSAPYGICPSRKQ